jgi:outer membrane immunogenic protein
MNMNKLKLKNRLLASVAVVVLGGVAVQAADIPRPLPLPRAPVYVPFFTWTGFYAGINAGYAFGSSSWTDTLLGIGTGSFDANGAMVGGTLGYNWQIGSAVIGVEGDIDWSGVKGTTTVNCPLGCETKNTWFGTIRGRLGYAFDRFMPYFTAGGAFGDVQANTPGLAGSSDTKFGWVVGGGLEYAFLSNWSAKIEYLYADLGTMQCPAANCGLTPVDVTLKLNIVRAGLNFKF